MDVDTGVDDAQALMMLCSQPDADILAVTCTGGNTGMDNVLKNTMSVLHVMGKTQVPVYRGCPLPILGCEQDAHFHHGENGLGGYVHPEAAGFLDAVQEEHACSALIRLANQHPGEITLVATAPLTNVGIALRMDPTIGTKFKEVVIMGGNLYSGGNDFLCAEFNFGRDPESAHISLELLKCPVTLVTFEVCKNNMKLPWEWYQKMIDRDTPRARFNKAIDEHATNRKVNVLKLPHFYSYDPLAVAVAVDPSIILASESHYCTVELAGSHSRGGLVVDRRKHLDKTPNVRLVTDVDTQKIRALFEIMLE